MKFDIREAIGAAHCGKHDREYLLLNDGGGCPLCKIERTVEQFREAEQKAKNSGLHFP